MGLGKGQGVLSFLKLDVFSLVNMSVLSIYVFCMCICAPRECLVQAEVRKGRRTPWNWSHGWW